MSEIKAQHVATDEDIARWKESDTPFPAVALDEAIARIEQQEETIRRLRDATIERAEQACRYVLKHQNREEDSEYWTGFEIACQLCEKAIRRHVEKHAKEDAKEAVADTPSAPPDDSNGL